MKEGHPDNRRIDLDRRRDGDRNQRLRAESALRESQARYSAVVKQSADCIFLVDAGDKRIIEANPSFYELLGYTVDDLAGKTLYDIVVADRDQIDRNTRHVLAERERYLGERSYRHKAGYTVDVEVSVHRIVYEGNEAMCAVARDITARKEAEIERERLEKQLRQAQKMEAIGQLTAGVAHNFNNMLAVIMGNLELALPNTSPRDRNYLEEALKAGDKAAEMVHEMRLFSRDLDVDKSIVNIFPVVQEAVEICRKTFDRKISIDLETPADVPAIHSNGAQLRQMLMHLCINARDALEALPAIKRLHHSIKISIDKVVLDADTARRHPQARPGEYVRIGIADNGIGMSEETQRRIFEPFYTTKGVDKGTGLGLSTVYAIAQQHRGWIEVESMVYVGTQIDIFLAVSPEKRLKPSSSEGGSDLFGTETVLVIEDEDGVREMLKSALVQHGYSILESEDGRNGLQMLHQHREEVAMVLLDLSLPTMSGTEVLGEINARYPDVKVIICTGYSTSQGHFDGADDIIEKPFKVKDLMRSLRNALDD